MDSGVILMNILIVSITCLGGFYTTKLFVPPKFFAVATIEESTKDKPNQSHNKGRSKCSCGLCVQVTNDGSMTIVTKFIVEYRYKNFLGLYKPLRRFVLCSKNNQISSTKNKKQMIKKQDASDMIGYILNYGGEGKLVLEYSPLGSDRKQYANIVDIKPFMKKYREILREYPEDNCIIGDIGHLVNLLVAELSLTTEKQKPNNDFLNWQTDLMVYKLLKCLLIAKNMTASLYEYPDSCVCSGSHHCSEKGELNHFCPFEKYKACAIQLEKVLKKHVSCSVNSLFTLKLGKAEQLERKMIGGTAEKLKKALDEWAEWHQSVGKNYRLRESWVWWRKGSGYSYYPKETIQAPLRLSLLKREEKLPPPQ